MRRVYRDESGKRHWVRGETEQEIADKIASIKEAVKRGEDRLDGKMLVSAWASTWLRDYIDPKARDPGEAKKRGTMTAQSCRMYHAKLQYYILPAIGKLKLMDVKDVHLQRILNTQARGMSDSHVRKTRIVIHSMFHQAYKSRLIPFDPSEDLALPAADAGERRSLTDYERKILLQVAATHKHGLWVRFLLATGIRPGESAPLQVYDLNFEAAQPRVRIYKTIEGGTNDTVSSPKTDAGFREVPLPASIIPDLKDAVRNKKPDAYVFPAPDGKSMVTASGIASRWRSFSYQMDLAMGAEHTPNGHIYDPSDLNDDGTPIYPDPDDPTQPRDGHRLAPDLCLYCLRHTYCTDLQRKGVPLNTAKYLMGHSNISTTANIYTHSGEAEVVQAGQLIDAANA
ncbi:MAG: tyrosine-type recombinase/integrase [bacterium]